MELDPGLWAGYKALGDSYWPSDAHADEQIAAYSRALELEPESWETVNNLASMLRMRGRLGEAWEVLARARARSPGTPRFLGGLILVSAELGRDDLADSWQASGRKVGATICLAEFAHELFYRGRLDRAREIIGGLSSRGDELAVRRSRAALALYAADWTEARRLYRDLYAERPGSSLAVYQGLLSDRAGFAWALAQVGRRDEAREIAADILSRATLEIENGSRSYLPRHRAAVALLVLGDTAAAVDRLASAVDVGYRDVRMMRTVPTLEPLRTHPRLRALAGRMDAMLAEQRTLLKVATPEGP